MYFQEGDEVVVHSLGPSYGSREFKARIRGIAVDDVSKIYIIEMVEPLDNRSYSHCTMPEACLRRGWN